MSTKEWYEGKISVRLAEKAEAVSSGNGKVEAEKDADVENYKEMCDRVN